MRWRVTKAKACGPHSVDLTFKDGRRKRVNLLPLLQGPVFQPLRQPPRFSGRRVIRGRNCRLAEWG